MVNFKLARQIENLERDLQSIKWYFFQPYTRKIKQMKMPLRGIVQNTAGLFGKNFPKGTVYEKYIRKSWGKRITALGL